MKQMGSVRFVKEFWVSIHLFNIVFIYFHGAWLNEQIYGIAFVDNAYNVTFIFAETRSVCSRRENAPQIAVDLEIMSAFGILGINSLLCCSSFHARPRADVRDSCFSRQVDFARGSA